MRYGVGQKYGPAAAALLVHHGQLRRNLAGTSPRRSATPGLHLPALRNRCQATMTRTGEEQRQALRSTWVSVWINVALASVQIAIGLLARSQALIADGVHSLSDLLSDVVVLFATHHAHAEADETHAYGHARFETAASLAIGIILLGTGVGLVWSAGLKLHNGAAMDAVHPMALAIALLTLMAKEALFHYMRHIGERLKSSMLIANAWHARADAASSLVVAVGIGANLMGYHSMDAVAAIIVGVMITKAGWNFTVEAFHSLTDHALDPEEIKRIRQTILSVDGVIQLHGLRTRRMGDWAVIDMHAEVGSYLSVSEGHYIAEKVSEVVRAAHRVAECTVHIDPVYAHRMGPLLGLPSRPEVQALLAPLLPAPSDLRLHYLDAGLEVDIDLSASLPAAELSRLGQTVHAILARHTRLHRVTLHTHPTE
jgi:cation diffusion facilitator family transporter